MQKAIIGKKIGMTQLFDEKGNVIVEDTKGIKTKDYIIKRKFSHTK